jgi:hypothetical protein
MDKRWGSIVSDTAKRLCPTTAKYSKEEREEAVKQMNAILYDGRPYLFGCCIICNKPYQPRGDHFVSAIMKGGKPHFRNGWLLAINHPMNMVPCCPNPQCNNESKKKPLLKNSDPSMLRFNNYYTYVLENCPTVNITEEQWDDWEKKQRELSIQSKKYTEDLIESSLNYHSSRMRQDYIEDIDDD